MSTMAVYWNMALEAFERNNPIVELTMRCQALWDFVWNYQSNLKLNRYRQSLYVQQFKRMEGFLDQGSPYSYRGEKLNRKF